MNIFMVRASVHRLAMKTRRSVCAPRHGRGNSPKEVVANLIRLPGRRSIRLRDVTRSGRSMSLDNGRSLARTDPSATVDASEEIAGQPGLEGIGKLVCHQDLEVHKPRHAFEKLAT